MKETDKNKQKRHNAVTFKPYQQDQIWLLPPSLGELIPSHHIVRLVNTMIDGIDLKLILNAYEGGGASNYHPRMMLKALIYGYLCKKYSSRDIERELKENICFMWLCGMQQPDHNTLNRFRKGQLKDTVKTVFAHILSMLIEEGYVRMQDYFVDGTKMESVANRYTFVWAKNVERFKSGLLDKIATLVTQIEQVNEEVEEAAKKKERSNDLKEALKTSDALRQRIAKLNGNMAAQKVENKKLKSQLKKLEKEYLPKLMEYENHEQLLDGRNSYSKTDPDATFMRTKDDHLQNGQLKPCYNWQFGTENQFVVNYTTHQTSSDMSVFTSHMDDTLALLDSIDAPKPKRVGADAGYGSEENYEYLEKHGMEAYVKYPGYYAEGKKNKKTPFHQRYLYYNETEDYFICPMGQKMTYRFTTNKTTSTGYQQKIRCYQAQNCEGCPLRGACFKAKGNRIIKLNLKAYNYRQTAKQRLNTLRGRETKIQRNIDVEPVFGHIKQCRHFRRFLLKGLDGVNTETGLLVIAHNLKKLWVNREVPRIPMPNPFKKPPNQAAIVPFSSQIELKWEKLRA